MSTMRFLAAHTPWEEQYARQIEFPINQVLYWGQVIDAKDNEWPRSIITLVNGQKFFVHETIDEIRDAYLKATQTTHKDRHDRFRR